MPNTKKLDLQSDSQDTDDSKLINRLLQTADQVFVKKLSNNDRDWAVRENKHQGGVYIPHQERDCGFFPALKTKSRKNPEAKEIRELYFEVTWTQIETKPRKAHLVHYTSKGQETHFTKLPRELFRYLSPASYLILAKSKSGRNSKYEAMTIDSNSLELELLVEAFELASDFVVGVFQPSEFKYRKISQVLNFADEVFSAWHLGKLDQFIKSTVQMPSTSVLSQMARLEYLEKYALTATDPFALATPGDALREMSREIEYRLFRKFQMRERSVELVRIVMGSSPRIIQAKEVVGLLLEKFSEIDALMVSAGNQRKSRAGYSYEHHIESMLRDGLIPFEKQVVIEAKKRPDFVLPRLSYLRKIGSKKTGGLILSAKTTLRERWKQVEREKGNHSLFLTTVDESIAANAIEEMASMGITLVVPETLILTDKKSKKNKFTEYAGHGNVISFHKFCHEVIMPRLNFWRH